jgi:hypothetical protein
MRLLLLAAFTLTSCSTEGDRAAERYEFLKQNSASASDLCAAARDVADAYSRDQNEEDIIYMTYRPEPDIESATGRRTEIKITPEMIEAGTDAMCLFRPGDSLPLIVSEVYRRMAAAASTHVEVQV